VARPWRQAVTSRSRVVVLYRATGSVLAWSWSWSKAHSSYSHSVIPSLPQSRQWKEFGGVPSGILSRARPQGYAGRLMQADKLIAPWVMWLWLSLSTRGHGCSSAWVPG
jgi:hypothetical protein